MPSRLQWLKACALARRGGKITPTLPNLVAAKAIVDERRERELLDTLENDARYYGIAIMRDGKRLDPEEFFLTGLGGTNWP